MTYTDLARAWDAHHIDNPSHRGHECSSWRCSADIAARLARFPTPPTRIIKVPIEEGSPDYFTGWRDGWDAHDALPEPDCLCPCGRPQRRHFSHEGER